MKPFVVALSLAVCAAAQAQPYPAKPVGNTPEEFTTFIRSEIDKWANLVKVANMKPE